MILLVEKYKSIKDKCDLNTFNYYNSDTQEYVHKAHVTPDSTYVPWMGEQTKCSFEINPSLQPVIRLDAVDAFIATDDDDYSQYEYVKVDYHEDGLSRWVKMRNEG